MKLILDKMSHPERVRFLYKIILRTHRALPSPMRAIGDAYVKEEFKKHVKCDPQFVGPFMVEWTQYAVDINKQIKRAMKTQTSENPTTKPDFGTPLKPDHFENFSEAQLTQLLALADELHGTAREDGTTQTSSNSAPTTARAEEQSKL